MSVENNNAIFMEEDEYQKFLEEQNNLLKRAETSESTVETNSEGGRKMTLYDFNQQIISQMPSMTVEEIQNAAEMIQEWAINENPDEYYMLLCNDIAYFTLFHLKNDSKRSFAQEVVDLLKGFYYVKMIHKDDNGMIAIWGCVVAAEDSIIVPTCFYLFPYGRGVIEVE